MKIADLLTGKKVLIWGYGREGKATEQFIKNHNIDCEYEVFEGKYEDIDCDRYNIIIKSPGIKCHADNIKLSSQTELFMAQFAKNIIGITGTKGKSTTASLLYYTLKKCGVKTVLVGNIGLPCLECYDEIDDDTVIVYEMSCHQLAHAKASPKISVLLNLYEEHLDYYDTMERYTNAKFNIFRFQRCTDTLIVNEEIDINIPINSRKVLMSYDNLKKLFNMKLKGKHNQYNANIVYYIATKCYDLDEEEVTKAIEEFEGLPHRMEYVGEENGVKYYDDSISTICQSAIQAVESLEDIGTIILGGMDRGIDYTILTEYFKRNTDVNIVCMYESGRKIHEMLQGRKNMYLCKDLEEAVDKAKAITEAGKSCVLSPAAASYDHFKNFEERGDKYKEYLGL